MQKFTRVCKKLSWKTLLKILRSMLSRNRVIIVLKKSAYFSVKIQKTKQKKLAVLKVCSFHTLVTFDFAVQL